MPKPLSPFPVEWPGNLKKIHIVLEDFLKPIIKYGYVYYSSVQGSSLHVSVVHKNDTFYKPGNIKEVEEDEMTRIIGSYGALSFVVAREIIFVFSQKRKGVSRLKEYEYGNIPEQDEIRKFLFKHTKLSFFGR